MDEALVEVLDAARHLGFVGPSPVEPHLTHALGFAAAWEAGGGPPDGPEWALDLGSGGGLPGLPLALHWPASRWLLLDASARRAAFLTDAVRRLGLVGRVEVAQGRAEDLGRQDRWRSCLELVTARSFGAPAVTAECASPMLAVGGQLVVSEPPADVGRWPPDDLAMLGLRPVVEVKVPAGRYVVLAQVEPCPDRYPRRVGIPRKRPLF